MQISLSLNDLMRYSEWERTKWQKWLRAQGDQVLSISAGPHGDGRFESIGDLVRHIFGAEKRYIERLSGRPIEQLTNLSSIPNNNTEALFQFGQQSRNEFRELVEKFPDQEWDTPRELQFPNSPARAYVTPRKMVLHVLLHEIRHWAQIATMLRFNGLVDEWHDFLFSPVYGEELKIGR